jgi:hypothetical protein
MCLNVTDHGGLDVDPVRSVILRARMCGFTHWPTAS